MIEGHILLGVVIDEAGFPVDTSARSEGPSVIEVVGSHTAPPWKDMHGQWIEDVLVIEDLGFADGDKGASPCEEQGLIRARFEVVALAPSELLSAPEIKPYTGAGQVDGALWAAARYGRYEKALTPQEFIVAGQCLGVAGG